MPAYSFMAYLGTIYVMNLMFILHVLAICAFPRLRHLHILLHKGTALPGKGLTRREGERMSEAEDGGGGCCETLGSGHGVADAGSPFRYS